MVTALIGLLFSSKVRCPVTPSISLAFIALVNSVLSVVPALSIAFFKTYTVSYARAEKAVGSSLYFSLYFFKKD